MAKKKIVGFISGAYCSDQNDYPTHSLVTLDGKDIKKILGFMDKLKTPAFRGVNQIEVDIATCEWFRICGNRAQGETDAGLEAVAETLGISADELSNIDTDDKITLTEFGDIFDLQSGQGNFPAVEAYSTGGSVYCYINKTGVYWQGFEKHSGVNIESPLIHRATLETWLKGV